MVKKLQVKDLNFRMVRNAVNAVTETAAAG
jgi:hypothetical protein